MNITIKEGLLIKNMIGYYMTNNNLYYDNNKEVVLILKKLKNIQNDNTSLQSLNNSRKLAKKVLKKHYYERISKVICGVK